MTSDHGASDDKPSDVSFDEVETTEDTLVSARRSVTLFRPPETLVADVPLVRARAGGALLVQEPVAPVASAEAIEPPAAQGEAPHSVAGEDPAGEDPAGEDPAGEDPAGEDAAQPAAQPDGEDLERAYRAREIRRLLGVVVAAAAVVVCSIVLLTLLLR